MKAYRITYLIERLIWRLKKLPYLCRMRVKFLDNGEVMEAENGKELVSKMRINSYVKSDNNKDYMLGYSRRAVLSANQDIRATSEEEFIHDLVRLKHIELI